MSVRDYFTVHLFDVIKKERRAPQLKPRARAAPNYSLIRRSREIIREFLNFHVPREQKRNIERSAEGNVITAGANIFALSLIFLSSASRRAAPRREAYNFSPWHPDFPLEQRVWK